MSTTARVGDGVWAPSHDEEMAIFPICRGPIATLIWLRDNFADHGNDISVFVAQKWATLIGIATFHSDPYAALLEVLKPFLQIPVYAVNDTAFHIPATIGDILSFCQNSRRN